MKKDKNRKFFNKKRIKTLILSFIISAVVLVLFPIDIRMKIGYAIITAIILPIMGSAINEHFLGRGLKKTTIASLVTMLIGTFIPSVAAVTKPDVIPYIFGSKTDKDELDKETFDNDLIEEVEKNDAIEDAATEIDNSVFDLFYNFSYIRNREVQSKENIPESVKIKEIMDMIVHNIELSGIEQKRYSNDELNSGEFSKLVEEANKIEHKYHKEIKELDKGATIANITKRLELRKEAFKLMATDDLAKLIGNTYVELSEQQHANEKIISNCNAIQYYLYCCHLSEPAEKSKMYYEIGVRFNQIAETANDIFSKENTEEYKNLYIDSLYISAAYYELFKTCYIEDFKNNFYLAKNYKALGENSIYADKVLYFEKAIDILHILQRYTDLTPESARSVNNTIYNILLEYQRIPTEYWNCYDQASIEEKLEDVKILRSQYR